MDQNRVIDIKSRYLDDDYRDLIRTTMKFEFDRQEAGTRKFLKEKVFPTIQNNLNRIRVDGKEEFRPHFNPLFDDHKVFNHFTSEKYQKRRFNDNLLRIADAFLQITVPYFNKLRLDRELADSAGMTLGAFLRDEALLKDRYQLSLSQQALIGIYQYQEVDSHQYRIGEDRFLAMFAGKHPDYISLVDVCLAAKKEQNKTPDEALKAYIGFCIPGVKFSPAIMRTACFRRRQFGLLYTPGSLIDAVGGALDEITYEVFTTDTSTFGSKFTKEKYGDSSFAKALDIHYGPKKRRQIERLAQGQKLDEVSERIELIQRNMI